MNVNNLVVLTVVLFSAMPALAADVIQPGPGAQERVQEALILAEAGQVIEFAEGVFEFTRGLSLDVDRVTLKGRGMDKTIFSFKKQDAGSEGLIVTSDGVVLRDFAVEDTIGDAIKVKGANGVSFLNIRTEWTGGPKSTNGAYGLYPVESTDVLIDGCVAIGASDAGIYVGQSKNIIVRRSTAKYNVAGIEIENSYNADVYECTAVHNTGGILVFDLPNLPQQGGHNVRVFRNQIKDNDTPNFAPEGNIVGNVPTGTGLMIMANRNVEVFENEISGNHTANLIITAYMASSGETVDPNYYPYPEGVHVHHNTFGPGGREPQGLYGLMMLAIAGKPLPDIVWDGRVNKAKFPDGRPAREAGIYIRENRHSDPNAVFVNLDLERYMADPKTAKISRDLTPHAGELPPVPGVKLPQDS